MFKLDKPNKFESVMYVDVTDEIVYREVQGERMSNIRLLGRQLREKERKEGWWLGSLFEEDEEGWDKILAVKEFRKGIVI